MADSTTETGVGGAGAALLHVAAPHPVSVQELISALQLGQPRAAETVSIPAVRAGSPYPGANAQLGCLSQLQGVWFGSGFNLIARPDKHDNKPFFLELNATREELEFNPIAGAIPNRGSAQDDIAFLGLTYVQRVTDAVNNGGLHIEPGIWINVPATTAPAEGPTVARMASIPHGNALLAGGQCFLVHGGPRIAVASSTPVDAKTGKPVTDPKYLQPFKTTPPPAGIPAGAIANPNLVLTDAIAGQNIIQTSVLVISTSSGGGVENIPFLVSNADATSMTAIFWIETVRRPDGTEFLQLQYTQTVTLNFLGINWPHIQVATLIKF